MNKNSSKRITTRAELISKIASLTNTLDFDPIKPLNIERYKKKREGEKLYEEEVEKHKNKISELLQKIKKEKTNALIMFAAGTLLIYFVIAQISRSRNALKTYQIKNTTTIS